MFISSSVRSHTYFVLVVPGPGGIKLLKSGSQVLECLLLWQRRRCSPSIYKTHDEPHGRHKHCVYWSSAARDSTWSLYYEGPWKEAGRAAKNGGTWDELLEWGCFLWRRKSVKALIRPLIHSLTHSLTPSFIHPHSFIQTFIQKANAALHMFIHWTHWTRRRKNWWNWEENSLVRTRCRCVHMTLRQTRMLQSNDFRISFPSWKLWIWILRDFNT